MLRGVYTGHNPHWTPGRILLAIPLLSVPNWIKKHSHSQEQVLFACICASCPVWIGPNILLADVSHPTSIQWIRRHWISKCFYLCLVASLFCALLFGERTLVRRNWAQFFFDLVTEPKRAHHGVVRWVRKYCWSVQQCHRASASTSACFWRCFWLPVGYTVDPATSN